MFQLAPTTFVDKQIKNGRRKEGGGGRGRGGKKRG